MATLPNFAGSGRPLPAEQDISGVIEDGNGTEFSKGDEVFGFIAVGQYGYVYHQPLQY